jgi:hypothetical protein
MLGVDTAMHGGKLFNLLLNSSDLLYRWMFALTSWLSTRICGWKIAKNLQYARKLGLWAAKWA